MSVENIWLIQTAFLGDAILTLPMLARLCELKPHARVTVISGPAGFEIFKLAAQRGLMQHAHRIRIVNFDKRSEHRGFTRAWSFAKRLRGDSGIPDVVFCVQRSFRSGVLALMSGARDRVGFSSGAASFLYTAPVARQWNTGQSEIEKNLDLLRNYFVGESVPAWGGAGAPSLLGNPALAHGIEAGRVVMALGSPWATKRWPVVNAIPLVNRLTLQGHEVWLVGDPSAIPIAAELQAKVPSLLLRNLVGKTNLTEWVDLLAQAQVVLSGDSAAVHAASDLNRPVVAMFGPTLPEFGFAPWRPGSLALGVSGLECRPCHIHGPKKCPLGHHKCLSELSPGKVYESLQQILLP